MTATTPGWSLDRRISVWAILLLVIALLGQAGGGVSWATDASARLKAVEAKQAELKGVPVTLGRIDERLGNIERAIDRMERAR